MSVPAELELAPLDGLGVQGALKLVEAPATWDELVCEHFDTDDLQLVRRGITLTHSAGTPSQWSLELPKPTKSGVHQSECRLIQLDGDGGDPPVELLDLLTAYLRDRRVHAVVQLHTTRLTHLILDSGAEVVAEIDEDSTAVKRADRIAARFRHIEIGVCPAAAPDLLDALVNRLRDAGATEPDPLSALVRSLGPRALSQPELQPLSLTQDSTAGDVLKRAMNASVNLVLDHDHVIRLDDDIEGVHQARVGTRRLRSNLRSFAGALDPGWAPSLADHLRWLARSLGEVRDCDVLLSQLRVSLSELPEVDRRGAEPLLALLAQQRAVTQQRLLGALRSTRYVELMDELVASVQVPSFAPIAEDRPKKLVSFVKRPFRKVTKAVERFGLDPTDEELHELRIDVKRARYATEVIAPALGDEMRTFAKALAGFGDLLGNHHDASVAEAWLRGAVVAAAGGSEGSREDQLDVVLAAGQIIASQRELRRQLRRELPAAWEKVTLAVPWKKKGHDS